MNKWSWHEDYTQSWNKPSVDQRILPPDPLMTANPPPSKKPTIQVRWWHVLLALSVWTVLVAAVLQVWRAWP